jgi:pimeloyl-ACP methyl ester carboxylesterase
MENQGLTMIFWVEFLTEDIFQLLKLEIDKASFVGFSMGGAVSFQMAVSPELVDKLMLLTVDLIFDNMGKNGYGALEENTAF